jgi:hypothetical protein
VYVREVPKTHKEFCTVGNVRSKEEEEEEEEEGTVEEEGLQNQS